MNRRNRLRNAEAEAYAIKAKEIHAQNTIRVDYYRSYLWRLFLGAVDVKVPSHWSIDYFRAALFWGGGVAVTALNGVVVPMVYTVETLNPWHYPVKILSSDTVQAGERKVGVDAELIYLNSAGMVAPFASGLQSMIDLYAQKLANCDGGIDTNLLTSRTAWLAEVADNKEYTEAKIMFTKIMSGEPAIFHGRFRGADLDKKDSPFTPIKVKDNFVADTIQSTKRMIVNEFLTAIGINNANMEKRERLISSEVNANNAEIDAAVSLWQSNINLGIDKVKAMFGASLMGELSVKFKGVRENESTIANGDIPDQATER